MKKLKKLKKYIAARGEHTGHKHVFKAEKDSFMNVVKEAENAVIEFINGNSIIEHEEHNKILFVDGNKYKQYQMREVDPFTEITRKVRD